MNKEIIIDGVNVAECRLKVYNSDLCNGFKMDNSGFHQGHCKQNPNCYFKQLKRLQEENKRLQMLSCANCGEQYLSPDGAELYEKNVQLQAENERLKKEIKSYKCQEKFPNQCRCAFRCLGNEFCEDADKKINKYRKALEEIREYASAIEKEELIAGYAIRAKSALWRIVKKINEVLK